MLDVGIHGLSLEGPRGRAWEQVYFLKDLFLLCFLLTLPTKPQFLGGLPWVWVLGPGGWALSGSTRAKSHRRTPRPTTPAMRSAPSARSTAVGPPVS